MIIASLLSLAIALYCYAISQLQQHGQLRWGSDKGMGFWDRHSDTRKYTSKIPFAKTWFVFLTDGYHHMQFWFFNFLSLSIVLAIGFNWWLFLGVLFGTRVIHWSARQILSK